MSRLLNAPVAVVTDAAGTPRTVHLPDEPLPQRVVEARPGWREWIGSLSGEPERDVWIVETERRVCELHCLRQPTGEDEEEPAGGEWLLHRWMD